MRVLFRVPVIVTRNSKPEQETVKQRVLLKVRGLSTSQWTAGNDAELLNAFRVVGRQQVQGPDGQAATQYLIEPIDLQPIEDYLRKRPGGT